MLRAISDLMMLSYNLNISGKYYGIERVDRTCELCNTCQVEDEYHFVMLIMYIEIQKLNIFHRIKIKYHICITFLNATDKKRVHKLALYSNKNPNTSRLNYKYYVIIVQFTFSILSLHSLCYVVKYI